ncbi:MAG: hypothetical protein ABW139_03400 [Candidatus Thiodiazotropha sp. DIVDIV]
MTLTSFAIGSLFLPLILFITHLESNYTGAAQLNSLAWYELFTILALFIFPFSAMKLLQVSWNRTKESHFE